MTHTLQSTLCAALTVTIFSWPSITATLWVARGLWYSTLFLSIMALVASTQETTLLDSMGLTKSHLEINSEILQRILSLLLAPKGPSRTKDKTDVGLEEGILRDVAGRRPSWIMLFIWQCPSMLMSYSWVLFVAALTLHVTTPLIERHPWGGPSKVSTRSAYADTSSLR